MMKLVFTFILILSFPILGSSLSSKNLSMIENYLNLNHKKLGRFYIKSIKINDSSKLLNSFDFILINKKNKKAHITLKNTDDDLIISADGYFNFNGSIDLARKILRQAIIRFNRKQKNYKASFKTLNFNRITTFKLESIGDKKLDINFFTISLFSLNANKYITFNVYLSFNSKSKYVAILRKTLTSIVNKISINEAPKNKDIMLLRKIFEEIKNFLLQ